MKEQWDKRYASQEYIYGEDANKFFVDILKTYPISGKLLCAAEGEGRNAVYGAQHGLDVSAFDISTMAREKAIKLAESRNVQIDYRVGQLFDLNYEDNSFDALVLTFAHVSQAMRQDFHRVLAQKVKPGGIVILEAFSKDNFEIRHKNPNVGGPSNIEMLFTKELISDDFQDFNTIILEQKLVLLNEGLLHNGEASVIRFVGKRNN